MREKDCKATAESLFVGGGEMGALLRSHDWSQTSLGSVETWSDELKTAAQIVLTELDRAQPTKKAVLNFDPPPNATEAALHQSEAKYRTLFEAIDQGFCVCELIWDKTGNPQDYLVLEINSAFERLTGLKHVAGKVGSELLPNLEPFWLETYARVVRTGESARFESHIQGLDGWFDVYVAAIDAPESDQFAVVFQNITERKRTEEILRRTASLDAFRVALADALRSLSDPIKIQAVASRVLGEYLGANRVTYFEVHGADCVVEQDYVNGSEPIAGHYPIASFDPRQLAVFRQGRTATSSDVPAKPYLSPEQRSAFAAIQIGAYIGVPLMKQGEFVAGLAVHTIEPRVWAPDEVALAEEVAERTWAAVERSRAEAALSESRAELERQVQKFDTTLSTITDLVFSFDRDGRFLHANQVLLGLWGLTAEQAIGKTMADLNYPVAVEQQLLNDIRRVFEAGETVINETPYTNPAGIDGYFEYVLNPVFATDGTVESVVGSSRDISDRKAAEAALRQSEERTRNILEIIHEAFFALDENWQFTYINPSAEALLDRAPDELVGRNIWEEYPGLAANELAQIYWSTMRDRIAASMTAFYPDHDRWYEVRTYPAPTGIAVYFRNVTDQIQAEEALRQSEARFRRIFECNMVPIAVWTTTGGITQANDALLDMIGYTRQELETGQINWQALTPPEYRSLDEIALNEIATKGVSAPYEKVYVCKDGRRIPILIGAASFLDDASSGIFFAIDLTDRKQAKAALQESEERYRTLFESIDQGFCLLEVLFDANDKAYDYRYLEINEAFEQQSGLTNAVGKTIRELVPNLEPQWGACYDQVVKLREAVRFEADVPSMNRVFDIYAVPSGAPGQNLVSVLFTDITERKRREAIIATDLENTRLLRDLSARLISEDNIQVLYDEIMATAIALTKADAGTVQILDEATRDLVLLASQGFDRTMNDHFYRVNASSNTSCGVVLTKGTRTFIDFDVPECNDPDGSLQMHVNAGYLSAQSTPLISRSGKAIGMVSTHWCRQHRPSDQELRFLDLLARQAADLIEQRQTEAERQQILQREQAAREEAEQANRIKDEFLAVLSHELRSPLNPILGWTRLLQNGKLDEARRVEALRTIERNAKLQSQLIEDLLDISRIMQGKLSLTVAPVNLPFVISAAIETVRLAAEAKHIQITLDLDPAVSSISGDAARLQQVVWNLLTNAVKFTPNGGQVTVGLRQLDGLAQIRVIDTGKGINPLFLPHVFEYFRQEDGSTTRKFSGLGLGLAIVQQIVEMHGGTVGAESQGEGQGATFIVQLPTIQQTASISFEPTSNQIDIEMPLAGIQILLVDDEPDTREFQSFLLEQSGATVTAVASGLEALQALERFIPDLLVSDVGMPEMDGYMLLQQIRLKPPNQGGTIPAIALTAYAAEIDQQRALQSGFKVHITKPVESEALVKTIASLLERT